MTADSTDKPEGPARVLLVNDNPTQLDRTKALLAQAGAKVSTAATAEAALDLLDAERPELIISDVVMPGVGGIELCRRLKSTAATADLPVLLVSGLRYDDAGVLEGLEAGADDYLEADAPAALLLKKVERLVAQLRAGRARRAAEESLRLLGSAVEQSGEAILITTPDLDRPGPRIVYVNPEMLRTAGYKEEEMLGQSPRILQGPKTDRGELARLRRDLSAGRAFHGELVNYRKDGSEYVVSMAITPIRDHRGGVTHFVSVERDITRQRLLEMQLRHAQKMEAVGRLAGGVAHDFNNILTAILSYSQLVTSQLTEGDPLRSDVEEIGKAGVRAAELTGQLLAFSHRQVMQPQIISLNDLVKGLERMLHRLVSEEVQIVTTLAEDLGHVRADPGQIQQVLMNLVVNARDAMPTGGKITIETMNVECDEVYADTHVGVTRGPHVLLSVRDTGIGIDRETMSQIFEPFFTTKGVGKGTGMGLPIVYGIVEQSGGHVTVTSEVGRGATFRVYLPVVEGEATSFVQLKPAAQVMPGGAETVLLVEDEAAVRKAGGEVLKRCGYTVLEAANAGEALLTCERHAGDIHLLITDVILPQMCGMDLAERLLLVRPNMKVLYMSGYLGDDVAALGTRIPEEMFLEKPFAAMCLAEKVRDVLDRGEKVCPA